MEEEELIEKLDIELEKLRSYAMTDEEVFIVKKAYELLSNK